MPDRIKDLTTTLQERSNEQEKVLPLWDHLAELSRRLRVWITCFIITTMGFMIGPADLSFVNNPLGLYRPFIASVLEAIRARTLPANVQLIAGDFTAPIMVYFLASAIFGFAVTTPVLAYETYKFVTPGLTEKERDSAFPFVTGFSILFAVGLLFGFYLLTPIVIWSALSFAGFTGAAPVIKIDDFYYLVFFTTAASGLTFTFPVFLVLLARLNIIHASTISHNRKFLYPIVYVITGIVTPDSNPVSDILLFIPIILLLEAALWIARRYEKTHPATPGSGFEILRCSYCKGPIDAGGVFCGHCGRSRL